MLDKKETQKALDDFRKYVIQQSRTNLTKSKKNSSKKLYDSINGCLLYTSPSPRD